MPVMLGSIFKRYHNIKEKEIYKTFWRRFVALIIDLFVMWPIGILLGHFLNKNGLVFTLIDNLSIFAYSILLHGICGQTLGKFILKIKVLTILERKISFKSAFIRNAIPLFLAFLLIIYMYYYYPEILLFNNDDVLDKLLEKHIEKLHINSPIVILLLLNIGWYMLEILTMFTNNKRRALHDLIADTVVIKKVPNKGISKGPFPGTNLNSSVSERANDVNR
ncbi:MAG: RDD family protein [Candidatus Brocadiaceae bacterium]|nr:RDD family protein [Candidatus Brocadiaceae bacterium]